MSENTSDIINGNDREIGNERKMNETENNNNSNDANNNESIEVCSVCLSHFCNGDEIRTLPCNHEFHINCIDRWLRERATCPVCRHNVRNALNNRNQQQRRRSD